MDRDIDTLNAIQQSGVGKDLKSKYNTITFDESTNLIVENKNYELSNGLQKFNKNFEDFYDIIINIKSKILIKDGKKNQMKKEKNNIWKKKMSQY